MTLLRRAPRAAYRVYSEEEFFAAEVWSVAAGPDAAPIGEGEPRPWRRAAGIAALAAVATAVAGVVAINEVRSRAGADRRLAGRRVVPEPPREAGPASSLPADRGSPSGDIRRRRARRASTAVRRVAERHVLLASAPPPVVAHTSAPTATTASTGGARPEFGFER